MTIRHIIATDEKGGYSHGGETPWYLPEELATMRQTMEKFGGIVLVGRNTWSVMEQNARSRTPDTAHSFGQRHVYVVSSETLTLPATVVQVVDIDSFVAERRAYNQDFWVASGGLYADIRLAPDEVWRTAVQGDYGCDAFYAMPPDMQRLEASEWHEENGVKYRYELYKRLQLGAAACESMPS